MDAANATPWKLGQPRCFLLCRVLLRFVLEQARMEADMELRPLARAPKASDAAQAFDLITAITFL